MKISSAVMIFLFSIPTFLSQISHSTTVLIDGVSVWKNPIVHVGDSIIFKHKYHYNLYIFKNQRAFNLCNFTQSTIISKPNSTFFMWHPSRTGSFYFTFNNGSLKTCQDSQMLAIKVSPTPPPSPEFPPMAAPTPTSGGGSVRSSSAFPWPFRPHEADSPSPTPTSDSPVTVPSLVGGTIPFINSNPAVPLPNGEVDSATINPVLTASHGKQVVVEWRSVQIALIFVVILML